MCSQYVLNLDKAETKEKLSAFMSENGISIDNSEEFDSSAETPTNTLPYRKSFVAVAVLDSKQNLKLKKMQFSLVPSWSKEPKVKFATHNARIETVLEKPTWKKPFTGQHCLIPLTGFFESVYLGPLAGNVIEFHSEKRPLLLAAGIYDTWVSKETGEVIESFAILTKQPDPFILENGHDRMPLFLLAGKEVEWLKIKGGEESLQFLRSAYAKDILWNVRIFRPLKTGWEKKIPI